MTKIHEDPVVEPDDDPVVDPVDDPRRKLSTNEMDITKLHLAAVLRYLLGGNRSLHESDLIEKVDPVTKAIVRNEMGYETTERGKQPTNSYDTEAEYNAQLDLLYDAVVKVAPKAKTPIARPQPVARRVRPSV